jgi:hypothetical protein
MFDFTVLFKPFFKLRLVLRAPVIIPILRPGITPAWLFSVIVFFPVVYIIFFFVIFAYSDILVGEFNIDLFFFS